MKRYLARALREAANRMGTTPKAMRRKFKALPADQRAQYKAAKLRRIQSVTPEPDDGEAAPTAASD